MGLLTAWNGTGACFFCLFWVAWRAPFFAFLLRFAFCVLVRAEGGREGLTNRKDCQNRIGEGFVLWNARR